MSSDGDLPHLPRLQYANPHLKKDSEVEEMSIYVPVDAWVQGVTSFSPDRLEQWASVIEDNRFFTDVVIAAGLLDFCKARRISELYDPLSRVLNRLLVLAEVHRSKMKSPPESRPIDDLVYTTHDANSVRSPEKPGLMGIRQRDLDMLSADNRCFSWDQAILTVELKYTRDNDSMARLDARCKKDELSEYGVNDLKALSQSAHGVPPIPQDGVSVAVASGSNTTSRDSGSRKRTRANFSADHSAEPPKRKFKADDSSSGSALTTMTLELEGSTNNAQMEPYAHAISASTSGTRLHCVGIYMCNHHITFWYIDVSGEIRTPESEALSLFDDFDKVAAIFIALSYSTPEQLGAFPPSIIGPPEHTTYPAAFPPTDLENFAIDLSGPNDPNDPYIVTLKDNLFTQYGLFGRRTCVYAATTTSSEHAGRVLAVKLSQQYATRTSEVELLSHARECGVVDHVPEILKARDFGKLSEDVRRGFGPDMIEPSKLRILRCIVTDHYVPLAEQLTENPDSLKTMVRQLLRCINDLRYKAHILHRDISVNNIMYTQREGEDWFVLIDFDRAVRVGEDGKIQGPTAHDRTGTLPFMAQELLHDMYLTEKSEVVKGQPIYVSSVLHCVRMDFESLTLVALWCAIMIVAKSTSKKAEEKARYVAHLQDWETGTYQSMSGTKHTILTSPSHAKNLPLSPHFKHLANWFMCLFIPFWGGIAKRELAQLRRERRAHLAKIKSKEGQNPAQARPPAESFEDYETLYGELTLETILASLDEYDSPE